MHRIFVLAGIVGYTPGEDAVRVAVNAAVPSTPSHAIALTLSQSALTAAASGQAWGDEQIRTAAVAALQAFKVNPDDEHPLFQGDEIEVLPIAEWQPKWDEIVTAREERITKLKAQLEEAEAALAQS